MPAAMQGPAEAGSARHALRAQASGQPPPPAAAPERWALRAQCSAPGKVILFGEHAVVYGEPAVSVALSLRTRVGIHTVGEETRVNGYQLHPRHHSYIVAALQRVWPDAPPLRILTESHVPSASGTGSSAALTVATVGALAELLGRHRKPEVAQWAFDAEFDAQGSASPNDTSCATAGGGVILSGRPVASLGDPLWTVRRVVDGAERSWHIYGWSPPPLKLVVGVTAVKSRTGDQVAKVRGFVQRSAFGRETVREVGRLALRALSALDGGDLAEVGRLMGANQNLLHTMGVNHPANQRLIDAALAAPGTLGAKVTGAGGGGSIVVLTDEPLEAARAIEAAGGRAIPVAASPRGVEVERDYIETPGDAEIPQPDDREEP